MKALLLASALIAAPLIAQSDTGTSITTKSATSKSIDKPLQPTSTPTVKDVLQPKDTSITTRSSVTPAPNMADQPVVPVAPPPPADVAPPPPPADVPPPPSDAPPPPPMTTPAPVVAMPSASVDQAFPPPAPKASYPWCSKTVTDGCKQRFDPK